ncbi:MAG TPA: SCP2 sterol-binding domain-containing protein [Polyangiaceae bacterium]|nr:SCP2 sterol-binding domain-containing protein [Polyangiaceae bacterium]
MSTDASSISTPKQLADTIEGRSDQEITEVVTAMGVEPALEKVFAGMKDQFLPAKAGSQSAVIQWDVATGGKTYQWQVTVAEGKCTVAPGTAAKPRVTLQIALPDFLRLVTGKIKGQQAFFNGKLKLSGDMMFAMTQESWFDMSFASK